MSDYICKELIFEIFTRLPPKSLLRFRSVSKALCSIISSPRFISMHTSRSPQKLFIRHQVSYLKKDDTKEFYTLHSEDQLPLCGYRGITQVEFPYNRYDKVVGSSNGILCLVDHGHRISVWNPSIRRKLTLPDCPWRCYSGVVVAFGFDPITDDYKIVSTPKRGGFVDRTFVYTLKKGGWCATASPAPSFSFVSSNACFVSGALHWIVRRYRTEESEDLVDFRHIMTFDLSTHVFGTIEIPEPSWEKQELTTIQGSLAMISTERGDSRIWLWRDACWTVVFELNPNEVVGINRVLHLTSNGDLLFSTYPRGFRVYNLKTGKRSRLVNFNDDSCLDDIVMYVESLQLLDMGTAFLEEANYLSLKQIW